MKMVTIKEIAVANGLNNNEANGLVKTLEKKGAIQKVGERKSCHASGKGRASTVYEIKGNVVDALAVLGIKV